MGMPKPSSGAGGGMGMPNLSSLGSMFPIKNPFSSASSQPTQPPPQPQHQQNRQNFSQGNTAAPSARGGLNAPRRDLLGGITPTSNANLPAPGIQPTTAPKQRVMKVHRDSDEIFEDSDADSQATEGADELPRVEDYEPGVMDDEPMFRSCSMGSELSWASSDSHLDDQSRDAMEFMKSFVNKIFNLDG